MAVLAERVLDLLKASPGLSDREITDRLFGRDRHQSQVNQVCRLLQSRGKILRVRIGSSPILNHLAGSGFQISIQTQIVGPVPRDFSTSVADSVPEGKERILLLGCVKSKAQSSLPARDLYVSPLWLRRRRYAERASCRWFIVSTQYGLVHPDTKIDPYDGTLIGSPVRVRRAWAAKVRRQLVDVLGDLAEYHFEFHAGREYRDQLIPLLEDARASASTPLANLRRGEQLSWYDDQSYPV